MTSRSRPARSLVKEREMMKLVTKTAGRTHASTRQFSQKRMVRRGAVRICGEYVLFTIAIETGRRVRKIPTEGPHLFFVSFGESRHPFFGRAIQPFNNKEVGCQAGFECCHVA